MTDRIRPHPQLYQNSPALSKVLPKVGANAHFFLMGRNFDAGQGFNAPLISILKTLIRLEPVPAKPCSTEEKVGVCLVLI